MLLILEAGRGTPLWRAPAPGVSIEVIDGDQTSVAGILEDKFYWRWSSSIRTIPPEAAFMLINLGSAPVTFELSYEMAGEVPIYDPYLFEQAIPPALDPFAFQQEQTLVAIPNDYIDTLAKWYSVKYTYQNYNLIFVRPGLGISFQIHTKRGEHWVILAGSPIVIAGDIVVFDTAAGNEFDLPQGSLHGIINPSPVEWAAIKETWTGEFDENDIERVFNPNHYGTPT